MIYDTETKSWFRQLTASDFAAMGMQQIAYVKQVDQDGHEAFAVHAADGSALAMAPSHELAAALIVRNDMDARSVH